MKTLNTVWQAATSQPTYA